MLAQPCERARQSGGDILTAQSSDTPSDEHPTVFRQTTDKSRHTLDDFPMSAQHCLSRARDNGIRDKDNKSFRRARSVYDGIELPYLLEELMVRYSVDFVRTPVNERCVFCNATYAGETKVKLAVESYAVSNHV